MPGSYTANNAVNASEVVLTANAYGIEVSIKSWKELRDEHIVKQDLYYSCGAVSFQDLSEVINEYGLKGMGLALGFEELKKLKIPVIAYMKHRDNYHFSGYQMSSIWQLNCRL